MKFEEMKISSRIVETVKKLGITEPTEIQEKAIPPALEGKDIVGESMTGSGKTLAFSIPIMEKMEKDGGLQSLILVPTRELANQVADVISDISIGPRVCKVFGGVSIEPQIRQLRNAEIVVGTPGRVLDHMNRRTMDLKNVKVFVLDEADRMLDMGFIDDIKRIMSALPQKRQNLLFSATVPDEIFFIIKRFMKSPERIKAQKYVSKHKLKQYYYDVKDEQKLSLLIHLVKEEKPKLAIIFCATKRMTDLVASILHKESMDAKAIHGDITQHQRLNVMEGFHKGKPHILVATDVASRGLDISGVSHIFNYDVPQDSDSYTHRVGRTARIGAEGKAITLLSTRDYDAFRRILRENRDIEKLEAKEFPILKIRMRQSFGGSFGQRRGFSRGPPRGRRGPPRHSGSDNRRSGHRKKRRY